MSLLDSLPTQEGHRGASESWAVCGTRDPAASGGSSVLGAGHSPSTGL